MKGLTSTVWTGAGCKVEVYRGTSLTRKHLPVGPTVGLFLGPYDSPGGGAFSYERGTPVESQDWAESCAEMASDRTPDALS